MNEFNYEGWIGSILDNYTSTSEFPAEGSENTLYIVRDGGQAQLYVWDSETSAYIEFAGGGGGGGSSDIRTVSLAELASLLEEAGINADGTDYACMIRGGYYDPNEVATATDLKQMLEDCDNEILAPFDEGGSNCYLTFNLSAEEITTQSGDHYVKFYPVQVEYSRVYNPGTGDTEVTVRVYSLKVIEENSELKVVPTEEDGPITGMVYFRVET